MPSVTLYTTPFCGYCMAAKRLLAAKGASYAEIDVACSCGNKFKTRSTVGKAIHVEVCSVCHPFYTGKQKVVDAGGRVDKFRKRYNKAATP